MSENTNLTTTITSDEYKTLLWRLSCAIKLADAVAADWLASTGYSFNKPSDATLKALHEFDHELYFETEETVKKAEQKVAETMEKVAERIINAPPTFAPIEDTQIFPNKGIEITCEAQGGTEE